MPRSWTDYRIEEMEEVAINCVSESCKAVNPDGFYFGEWAYGSYTDRFDRVFHKELNDILEEK